MTLPKTLIGCLLACATIAALAPHAAASPDASINGVNSPIKAIDFDSKNVASYWTPERMAQAAGPAGNLPESKFQIAAGNKGKGRNFDGLNQVGTFFMNKQGTGAHQCTGSVINSSGKNLVLTAGHCFRGATKIAFVPKWHMAGGKAQAPLGVWPVEKAYVYDAYDNSTSSDKTPHLDMQIVRVAKVNNKAIGEVTGMFTASTDDAWTKRDLVEIIGYPSETLGEAVTTQPRRCVNDIPTKGAKNAAVKNAFSTQMYCTSMVGGTSGSPWMDVVGKNWVIVAITGGEWMNKVSDADTSVGLKLGKNFRSLFAKAQKG